MQTVVELTLKGPLELRMIEIAWMQVEVVRVHRDGGLSELNDDFYALALRLRAEIEQRMFIQAQLIQHALQSAVDRSLSHKRIVEQAQVCPVRALSERRSRVGEPNCNLPAEDQHKPRNHCKSKDKGSQNRPVDPASEE